MKRWFSLNLRQNTVTQKSQQQQKQNKLTDLTINWPASDDAREGNVLSYTQLAAF